MQFRTGFIITSIINFSNGPLSYSDVRSVFSPEERAKQTVKTIESIRSKVPDADIYLIELGLQKKLPYNIDRLVDCYIYLGTNCLVRRACDGRYKGLGEAVGLIKSRKFISNKANYYFKISGRYFLDHNFEHCLWNRNKIIVRSYGDIISTRLYGFPKEYFFSWQIALWRSIPLLCFGKSIEYTLPKYLPKDQVHTISRLGVTGAVAPKGEILSE